MKIREWPKGHRLFSEGGFHMSFDPPDDEDEPAIVLKEDEKTGIRTVYAIATFKTDEAALKWFAEQRKKFAH